MLSQENFRQQQNFEIIKIQIVVAGYCSQIVSSSNVSVGKFN